MLATGGLDGVRLLGVDAAAALRGMAVLVAAHVGGAPAGALVGTAAGVLGLLGGQGSLAGLAWLAMAGTAAGLPQVELREGLERFLTPEQLKKWDEEVAKAKEFLGHDAA